MQINDIYQCCVFSLRCCLRRTQTEWRTSHIYVHFHTISTYEKCSYFSVAARLVSVQSTISLASCMTLSSISPLNRTLQETASMKVYYIKHCTWYVVLKASTSSAMSEITILSLDLFARYSVVALFLHCLALSTIVLVWQWLIAYSQYASKPVTNPSQLIQHGILISFSPVPLAILYGSAKRCIFRPFVDKNLQSVCCPVLFSLCNCQYLAMLFLLE